MLLFYCPLEYGFKYEKTKTIFEMKVINIFITGTPHCSDYFEITEKWTKINNTFNEQ